MTKERELLIQALEDWDFSDKFETLDPIFEEIRTYLSTSDDAEEPVGYAVKMIPKGLHFIGFVGEEETEEEIEDYGPDQIVPLYTRPEPARKPMTPKERSDGYMELEGILGPDAHLMSFLSGICAAEKHHGIADADL